MSDFSRFTSRYDISGELVLQSPVRIGAQKSLNVADVNIPVVRDGTGNPVIPGSSLKGVVRSYTESVLRTLQDRTQFRQAVDIPDDAQDTIGNRDHVLAVEPMTMQDGHNLTDTLSVELLQEWKEFWTERDDLSQDELDRLIIDATPLIQQVFGTAWLASKVYFRDAFPVNNESVETVIRDGVAIHRDRQVAQDGMLYSFEAIPAGTRFAFHLTAENINEVELGVLMIGLRALKEGLLRIGGGTSRGLGSVTLENINIQYVGSDIDSLAAYLADGTREELNFNDMSDSVNTLIAYIRRED